MVPLLTTCRVVGIRRAGGCLPGSPSNRSGWACGCRVGRWGWPTLWLGQGPLVRWEFLLIRGGCSLLWLGTGLGCLALLEVFAVEVAVGVVLEDFDISGSPVEAEEGYHAHT